MESRGVTRQAQYPDTMTPMSGWLRALGHGLDSRVISNHNLDYIWHNYRESWMILIEEKRYGARQTKSQADTHGIVDQKLHIAQGRMVKTLRGMRLVDYRGYYLIQLSATTPDDSEWMRINGKLASIDALMRLLHTGRMADVQVFAEAALPF